MKTASIGQIQKNLGAVLAHVGSGKEVTITKRGKPIAKIVPLSANSKMNWPDFYSEAIRLKGKPVSEILIENREDRMP